MCQRAKTTRLQLSTHTQIFQHADENCYIACLCYRSIKQNCIRTVIKYSLYSHFFTGKLYLYEMCDKIYCSFYLQHSILLSLNIKHHRRWYSMYISILLSLNINQHRRWHIYQHWRHKKLGHLVILKRKFWQHKFYCT